MCSCVHFMVQHSFKQFQNSFRSMLQICIADTLLMFESFDIFRNSSSARFDVWMHDCCVYGFMGLCADNIALMNIWCGSTSVPFGLHVCSWDWSPDSFFNKFHKYATTSSGPITKNSSRAKKEPKTAKT